MTKKFLVIACEILFREVCYCAALCKNIVDLKFMEKALHDSGSSKMARTLQCEIDKADSKKYDAILLVYALCNNGITGLKAKLPMVIPKAHDCITLLMGSKDEYMRYHNENPSAYYMSSGWMERDKTFGYNEGSIPSQLGINRTYQEYAEQYGEENARYLMETLGDWTANYSKYSFIDTGTGDVTRYESDTKIMAENKGWEYERIKGNVNLIMDMMDGSWDPERFLVLPPGKSIGCTYDAEIICAVNKNKCCKNKD